RGVAGAQGFGGAAPASFDVIILDVKGLGARAIKFGRDVRSSSSKQPAEIILLVGMDGYLVDIGLDGVDAAAVLLKPLRTSDLFNPLAPIAAGEPRRAPITKRPRRTVENSRPNFAARILV